MNTVHIKHTVSHKFSIKSILTDTSNSNYANSIIHTLAYTIFQYKIIPFTTAKEKYVHIKARRYFSESNVHSIVDLLNAFRLDNGNSKLLTVSNSLFSVRCLLNTLPISPLYYLQTSDTEYCVTLNQYNS